MGGAYSHGNASITGALGGGYSTTSGTRNLDANTVQRLADTVAQFSAAVRRLHSTVVVQAAQAEQEHIETRTVTNHNHCHALTVLYYEVLRHYNVTTRLIDTRDVLFIKYPVTTFSEETVREYRQMLEQALLDERLRPRFSSVENLSNAGPALALPVNISNPSGTFGALFGSALFGNIFGMGATRPTPVNLDEARNSAADRARVAALLRHLNSNQLHYSRAIWLLQDPDERARLFDKYEYSVGNERGRLIYFIENRPVGTSGDYVAFPLRDRYSVGEGQRDGAVLREQTAQRIVSLPTRGAFAESKLSNCNACEERDDTRFWDWSESPCPEAPEITGTQPGSRARDVEAEPSELPNSIVNIVNPPAAPDPTGMAAALSLLGTPDIFRDMSASKEVAALLQELARGASNHGWGV